MGLIPFIQQRFLCLPFWSSSTIRGELDIILHIYSNGAPHGSTIGLQSDLLKETQASVTGLRIIWSLHMFWTYSEVPHASCALEVQSEEYFIKGGECRMSLCWIYISVHHSVAGSVCVSEPVRKQTSKEARLRLSPRSLSVELSVLRSLFPSLSLSSTILFFVSLFHRLCIPLSLTASSCAPCLSFGNLVALKSLCVECQ